MARIGSMNSLKVVKILDFGAYFDGAELGEILLPRRQVPENCRIGDVLEVFLYHDTENRLIATIQRPLALVGEVGYLKVTTVNQVGAFLEWGIPKDLFVPFREQRQRMEPGFSYPVYVYFDEVSKRIAGSSNLKKFLGNNSLNLSAGQEVDVIVANRNETGYLAIVNRVAIGMLYHNEIFQKLSEGQSTKAYVKGLRESGKIDLVIERPGYGKIPDVAERILKALETNGGSLGLTDDSSPEKIKSLFGISKKTFKKALGALFKERRISIDQNRITLLKKPRP